MLARGRKLLNQPVIQSSLRTFLLCVYLNAKHKPVCSPAFFFPWPISHFTTACSVPIIYESLFSSFSNRMLPLSHKAVIIWGHLFLPYMQSQYCPSLATCPQLRITQMPSSVKVSWCHFASFLSSDASSIVYINICTRSTALPPLPTVGHPSKTVWYLRE